MILIARQKKINHRNGGKSRFVQISWGMGFDALKARNLNFETTWWEFKELVTQQIRRIHGSNYFIY